MFVLQKSTCDSVTVTVTVTESECLWSIKQHVYFIQYGNSKPVEAPVSECWSALIAIFIRIKNPKNDNWCSVFWPRSFFICYFLEISPIIMP